MLEPKSDDRDTIFSKIPTFLEKNPKVLEQLRGSAAKWWDYVTMEDFRKMIDDGRCEMTDSSIHPEITWDATVHETTDLSIDERRFINARKHRQRDAFAKFINVDPQQIELEDIPVVGVASSGGGYRAMVGATGFLKAMKETGALDCVMYNAGVSGSCWTFLLYYSSIAAVNANALLDHFKSRLHVHPADASHYVDAMKLPSRSTKDILQGAIRRYYQLDGEMSLVDLFGLMMSGVLLTGRIDNMPTGPMTLSGQQEYIKDGSAPMPIYCVVRHELGHITKQKEKTDRQDVTYPHEDAESASNEQGYQWFEFTPYTVGSEEVDAWIPTWAFGRRFEQGKNIERLPEATLDTLIGVFGSAFAASLSHFYNEIRSLLPKSALEKADEAIRRYEQSMASYHLISPARFPNPFYKLRNTEESRKSSSLVDSKDLFLMDAGVDNNIPFYPLLRPGRDVDVILALDLSADIQTAPHFDRAEGYVRRRGIRGWPAGAGWPRIEEDETKQGYSLGTCTVFASDKVGDIAQEESYKRKNENSIAIVYFPFIANASFDASFDPQVAEFCKTWNFVYSAEQVAKTAELAEANWRDNVDRVREVLRDTWERKRDKRRSQH